ncbi:MAG TPA: TIR domain-containing protein [Opitutus sp.]|nr:TIR domain-containing protein [Opitutus sp.]
MSDSFPPSGAIRRAVFLSYARDDAEAARRIADALRAFGIEVWFDQNELRGGDAWDAKIKKQIRECTLFVAVISAQTQSRGEGYFRREWKLAVERTHDMHEGVPFLLPVVVDETRESDALVPEQFMRVQWTRLEHGVPTPEFVLQVKRLLDGPRVPRATSPAARPSAPATPAPIPPAPTSPGRRLPTIWVVLAVFVVAAALLWFLLPRHGSAEKIASSPAASTVPAAETAAAAAPVVNDKPAVADKSIAVLPFINMSEDKDNAFFADGMQEDILTKLARVREFRVVSRTSVMQYRNTTKPIREIARELGVTYILEGSVQRAGDRVRVTGQLIAADKDEHVWANSYDRNLTDVFAIQADLSQEIASALKTALSPEERSALAHRPTENPVAYDDYLKGRDLLDNSPNGSPSMLRQSESYFREAVQQDPKFAAAWGELAIAYALYSFWGFDASPERLAEGDAVIAKAEQLAPQDPDVIESIGTYAYYAHRDYTRAIAQYEKLAALRPNDATVFSSLGLIQRRQGRWAESLDNMRRAIALDPANRGYLSNLVASLICCRRWDEARSVQQRLIAVTSIKLREQLFAAQVDFKATGSLRAADDLLARLTPAEREAPVAIFYRKFYAIERGDFAAFKQLDQRQPTYDEEEVPAFSAVIAGVAYHASGDSAALKARIAGPLADLQAQVQREPSNMQAWSYLAALKALAGNKDEARQAAQRAAELMPESRDALDGPNYQFEVAEVAALTGDKEGAIAGINHLLNVPSSFSVADFRAIPSFAGLRGDPRFEELMNDPKNNAPLF